MPCPTIRACSYATHHKTDGGDLISVGVTLHGTDRFYTLCLKDPLLGCGHFTAKNDGALIVIEKLSRVMRFLSPTP
jgi:hypothetical protein